MPAAASRSTISAPATPRCGICTASRSIPSRSTARLSATSPPAPRARCSCVTCWVSPRGFGFAHRRRMRRDRRGRPRSCGARASASCRAIIYGRPIAVSEPWLPPAAQPGEDIAAEPSQLTASPHRVRACRPDRAEAIFARSRPSASSCWRSASIWASSRCSRGSSAERRRCRSGRASAPRRARAIGRQHFQRLLEHRHVLLAHLLELAEREYRRTSCAGCCASAPGCGRTATIACSR